MNLAARADAFRLIISYKYGGIYFDLDTLFLRDFGTLRGFDFLYQWEKEPYANTAVLNLSKNSIEKALPYIQKHDCVVPWAIFNFANDDLSEILVLPCAFFDPVWMVYHGSSSEYDYPIRRFDELFGEFKGRKMSYKDFFKGAFAFHWHNQWFNEIHPNSLFYAFEAEFDKILMEKFGEI